ncbi:MAG TPA: ABC transporter ATP-binding protein [Sedimentisphaerales bacterium]|nr:ABC transporter ATP-binding protein [Sedimentisphaerales bacterium]
MSATIEVKNVGFSYAQRTILNDVSFEVEAGAFIAVAGPNGAGKSTLIKLLCGLLNMDKGSIEIHSRNISRYSEKELARKVAVVHQEFVPGFDFTVAETVAMARTIYMGTLGFESSEDKNAIEESLRLTDTLEFASRPINQLSGGERQRVFIARAIAQDTDILLLDEPTSFLDLKHQVGIYDLLKKMQTEKGKTIICVSHDINLANQYCNQSLLLGSDQQWLFGRTEDVFSSATIEKFFSVTTFEGLVREKKFFLPLGNYQQK